jgi:hypothetical protein
VLLSRWVYDTAVYGGLVAIVASAWYAIRHRERLVEPKLPEATAGRSFRRYVARIAPVIVLIGLIGGEWALLGHARDAVVIDGGRSAHRAVFIGTMPDVEKIGDGTALLVNRSGRSVKLYWTEDGDYRLQDLGPGETAIPEIDLLGPRAKPTRNDVAEHHTWLTWD